MIETISTALLAVLLPLAVVVWVRDYLEHRRWTRAIRADRERLRREELKEFRDLNEIIKDIHDARIRPED